MPSPDIIMTVAMGPPTEKLDRTFLSFAQNSGAELHAFIISDSLPQKRFDKIHYHLVSPIPDFSDPLREIYFRRLLLMDELNAEFVLVVDCYDVLCLQPLPAIKEVLGGCALAACTEHNGSRYIVGQGYTSNYLNGGVTFWNVPASKAIRTEVYNRGKDRFRAVVDDQLALNEIVQTRYYHLLRILPCQYNYRADLYKRERGWPVVNHLDGVMIYHNGFCIELAKKLLPVAARAELQPLERDLQPLTRFQQLTRRLKRRFSPHIVK